MKFTLIRERQPAPYVPPVYLDGPHRSRRLRRAENVKLLLILAIVLVTAAATRWLDDTEDTACSPVPHRVVDVSQGLN